MEPNKYDKIISFLENKMKDCDDSILVINKNELKNMFDELNVNAKDYKEWILDYLQDGLLTADEQTMSDIKNAINWLKSLNSPAAVHEDETHNDFSQFKPKFQVGDKVNLIDRPDVNYNILTIESVNMDEHCYVCNQGSVIDFSKEIIWRKVENDDTKPTRFDAGDFVVVRNGKCTKILKIEQADNADYTCMNISDGSIETIHVENLDDADSWIWSIEDAKPGDVLITDSNAITFIFKSHVENKLVSGYCRYHTDEGVFYKHSFDCYCDADEEVHPATIQQANKMFSEMHRLNFDWDGNHKEIIELKRNDMNESEPKFKIDDWIMENDNEDASPWQVVSIENGNYKLSNSHGPQNVMETEFVDKNYHLWSIYDAKDGDILVVKGIEIIIYHSRPDHMIDSYCSLIRNQFISTQTTYFGRVTPASEEQYNMLFDAMDAAGYEWIPESKTLKQTNTDVCFFKQGEWYQCIEDIMIDFINFDAGTAYFCSGEERLEAEDGNHVWIPENSYSNFKLWSISDAKDGDVLASSSEIFIYSAHQNNRIDSYCHLVGNLFIAGRCTHFGKTKPASKEQKALLFDKMKLNGYEWNETDKTLVKKTDDDDFSRKNCRAFQEQSKELSGPDSNKEKLIGTIKSMIAESVNRAKSNNPLDENTSVEFAYGRTSGLEDALGLIENFFNN